MTISKYHNQKYNSNVPYRTGDRRYAQDRIRDFRYLQDIAGTIGRDFGGLFPIRLSGGVVSQGGGANLNITAGYGYAEFQVEIPDSFASTPPSKVNADIESIRIAWDAQTNMGSGSPKCSVYSITDDGSTVHYVKVAYVEASGNSRNRAKSAGSYNYENTRDYTFTVNTVAPTDKEVCLATFTSSGGTYTITNPYSVHSLVYPTIHDCSDRLDLITPPGIIAPFSGIDIPSGWLLCDASVILRSTYAALYNAITKSKGTVTITIASPGVVSLTTHGFITGDCIELTTSGALPTGLSVNTNYYVIYNDANSFWLATSLANAVAGSKINTSGTQSGTHTLRHVPWGISGASNFLLPDLRNVYLRGANAATRAIYAQANITYDALSLGLLKNDRYQEHYHVLAGSAGGSGNYGIYVGLGARSSTLDGVEGSKTDGATTPRTGTTTEPQSVGINNIIKY